MLFFTRGNKNNPSGTKNYVGSKKFIYSRRQAVSQVPRPSGNVPLNSMTLFRYIQMEKRWERKLVSRWSPETAEMRRSSSERNSASSAFTGPMANGNGNKHVGCSQRLIFDRLMNCHLFRQVESSTSVEHCSIPGRVFTSRSRNKYSIIWLLAIGPPQKIRRLPRAWNICTLCTPNDVVYGLVAYGASLT